MNRSKSFWIIGGAVIGLGLFVRLVGLEQVGLWHDEAVAHFYGMKDPGWILVHSAGRINHPPLFFFLLHAWLHVVSPFDQFLVEIPNVLLGTITVGVVILWANRFMKRTYALFAGLLLALNPFHIYYSGELRMYALATLALTLSGYFAYRIIENAKQIEYIGWVLASLVALYTHSFTLVPIVLLALFLGWELPKQSQTTSYLISLGFLCLAYAPWAGFVFQQARRIRSDYWLPDFQFSYLGNLLLWVGGWIGPRVLTPGNLLLILIILAGFVVPLGLSFTFRAHPAVAMIWWISAGTVFLVSSVSLIGQSIFLYRTFVVLVPALLILSVKGLTLVPKRFMVVLGCLYLLGLGWETYRLKTNPPHQYVRVVAERVAGVYQEGEIILHWHHFSFYPAWFYHKRTYPEYLHGGDSEPEHMLTTEDVNRLRERTNFLVIYPANHKAELPGAWREDARPVSTVNRSGRTFQLIRLHKRSGNL